MLGLYKLNKKNLIICFVGSISFCLKNTYKRLLNSVFWTRNFYSSNTITTLIFKSKKELTLKNKKKIFFVYNEVTYLFFRNLIQI